MPRTLLKKKRLEKNMTQAQVAEYLGIAPRYYQRIESGEVLGHIKYWDSLEDLFKTHQRKLRVSETLDQQDHQETH